MFLRQEDIDWIEASDKYIRVHVGGEVHVARGTMKDMERRLDRSAFVRIHKSVILNVHRVTELEPELHGEYTVTLRDGTRLKSGRAFGSRLWALIG